MSDKCHTDKYRKRRAKENENKRVRVIRDRERERLQSIRSAEFRKEREEALERARLEDPRRPDVQKLVNILYARVANDPIYRLSRIAHAFDGRFTFPVYTVNERRSIWGPRILP